MNIILFDPEIRVQLLPLCFTRPVSEIRFGILRIREKWERALPGVYSWLTQEYLSKKYPLKTEEDNIFISANITPSLMLAAEVASLETGDALLFNDNVIAFRGSLESFEKSAFTKKIVTESDVLLIENVWDIFAKNHLALENDFKVITENRESEPVSDTVNIIGERYFADGTPKLFIEKGVTMEYVNINLKGGPVYIGSDVEIQEGSSIRAPFAACEHAVVNMNSKIYGATTLGPYCKVGGELNNVVMFGYANKAHEGFLGNAVIGQWCNLGAGTNTSNLKNDYSEIKLWNYKHFRFMKTGLQFCGLIMGDHSKAGINTMFNTATLVGVGCNIFGSGFPRTYIASFSEGGNAGFTDVIPSKFFQAAQRMMSRRNLELTDIDKEILETIYHDTVDNRSN